MRRYVVEGIVYEPPKEFQGPGCTWSSPSLEVSHPFLRCDATRSWILGVGYLKGTIGFTSCRRDDLNFFGDTGMGTVSRDYTVLGLVIIVREILTYRLMKMERKDEEEVLFLEKHERNETKGG